MFTAYFYKLTNLVSLYIAAFCFTLLDWAGVYD